MFRIRCAGLLLIAIFVNGAVGDDAPAKSGDLVVRGQVLNEANEPIRGATLVLRLRYGFGDEDWQVRAESSEDGRFEIAVPQEWTKPGAFYHQRTIWCYAPGYALTTGSAYKQLDGGANDPVSIQLSPETEMEFNVLDPSGKPLPGCRVEPHHWVGDIPPQAILDLTAATTDEKGIARLSAMQPSLLLRVAVVSDTYGTQRMQLDERSGSTTATIRLQDVGAIEGRFVCDDPDAIAGMRVAVGNMDSQAGLTEGSGEAVTKADGHFRIERVAEGAITVFVRGDKVPAYRPRLPEQVIVEADETTEIEIPFQASVLVRGSVVARGSEQPVAGAFVSVSYGDRYQNEQVLTDAEGRFEAHTLPGLVRQHIIVIPQPFRDWIRTNEGDSSFEVTADAAPFNLPPLEIVEPKVVEGSVIDEKGKPVAECLVTAQAGNRNLGMSQTDDTGSFKLRVAPDANIERYRVSRRSMPQQPVKVVSKSPIVLQFADRKELANVQVTTMPTPEEKRQPEFETENPTRMLIVAKNILIFDGRSTNWAELGEELEKLSDEKNTGDSPVVHYHLTHGAFEDEDRKTEAQNWAELLSTTTAAKVQHGGGLILNHAAERYDALDIDDHWPPGAEKPVVGRAVSASGEPVVGAQVVLLPPPPPTSRLRFGQSVYLKDGQVRQPMDHIIATTDVNGQFSFDFPSSGTNVMIVAPQGFALIAATEEMRDIELAPWARVTATLPPDERTKIQTMSISISGQPTGGGPTAQISMSAGSVEKAETAFEFSAVPPLQKAILQRFVWEERDGSKSGNNHGEPLPLDLESGITTHLDFGPLEESE